jgi:predicted XRE-type DNA-binding protein
MPQQEKKIRIRRGSSNVFRDLGFPSGEAAHLKVRSDLMIEVQKAISSRGIKQAEAARILGVSQPRISDLLRGRIDLFSTDTLIDMSARLGLRVRLSLRPIRQGRKVA